MAITVEALNILMDAAVTAVAAGDFATAINKALAAQGLIAVLPKASRSAGTGGGSQATEWDSMAIDNFVKRLRQQQGATLGIQSQSVQFVRPEELGNEISAATPGGYVQ